MRVRVKEGFFDETLIPPKNYRLDMSGFTGTCDDREYEEAKKDDDVVLVKFDEDVIESLPEDFVIYCDEELDEDYERYYFYKSDLEIIE